MGYLTVYARIQNLVKCEAPGAKITDISYREAV